MNSNYPFFFFRTSLDAKFWLISFIWILVILLQIISSRTIIKIRGTILWTNKRQKQVKQPGFGCVSIGRWVWIREFWISDFDS
ncbi:unnamed protein product [Rhizophagus irregularis]|nr:unnamed protein product [Rhizophagus irregularis]